MINDERSPKLESPNRETGPVGVPFDLRNSVFLRRSTFGFRHYREPPQVGAYTAYHGVPWISDTQWLSNRRFPTLSVSHPMGEGRLAAGRQAGGEGERDPKFDVVRVRPKGCCIRSQFCKFEFGE